jgi:hypothetical protein
MEVEKRTNISLVLDSYHDIFSSFDPRSYSERALSDDFLEECRRAVRDKEDEFELRLMIPKEKRNLREEAQIKKRLIEHFQKHHHIEEKKIKKLKRQGIKWFMIGASCILLEAWIDDNGFEGYIIKVLSTMLEPAGWFSFWEGLGKIFISAEERIPRIKFNQKMARAKIIFQDY